ncbi:hypothetical protein Rhow_002244 [Rhodococcus wratislaviensis]|uniref:Uncharacterized protein n=1 Tax=Rhodococcus wratislaviensis TaxID=44752 RepID=A0A402C525_RHOWR|nr:hypothetical protein Rhow_002244 [Rhodococcus wratislaviensis]
MQRGRTQGSPGRNRECGRKSAPREGVERARCHPGANLRGRRNQQQSMSATASMPTAINANSWRTWCTAASDTP